jgi:D-3-phosphoglycerate dehydrogenase
MKPGVLLINAARGGIMVEEEIAKALKEDKIGGAAFDVYSSEPPKEYTFAGLDKCITTPHLGASTSEAQVNVAVETASVIVDFFKKGVARNAVNYPSIAPDLYEQIKHHVFLSEKQGKLISALTDGKIKEVNIFHQGEVAAKATHIMKLSVLKGILEPILAESTNFLNAPIIAKERGINVNVNEKVIDNDYAELVQIVVNTNKGEQCVTGTVHQHGEFRIIKVNDFEFDFKPEGTYIMVKQEDKPGVVGIIGTILGSNDINIAEIQLSRKGKGKEAITFIHIDTMVEQKILDELKKDSKIIEAGVVNFD